MQSTWRNMLQEMQSRNRFQRQTGYKGFSLGQDLLPAMKQRYPDLPFQSDMSDFRRLRHQPWIAGELELAGHLFPRGHEVVRLLQETSRVDQTTPDGQRVAKAVMRYSFATTGLKQYQEREFDQLVLDDAEEVQRDCRKDLAALFLELGIGPL